MEESNSDSDSKENSVVESGIPKRDSVELTESLVLPEIIRERNDIKKSQFRGFYLTQKTLVVDSNTSSLDFDQRKHASSMETENEEIIKRELSNDFEIEEVPEIEQIEEIKNDVPMIVEEFVNVAEVLDEDEDTTENLDLPINAEDKAKIEKDHENPGITNDFKASVYQVKHSHESELAQNFLDILNTSDEEISELASDVPEVGPPIKIKKELRISLKSLASSEEDEKIKEEKSENGRAVKI